MGIQVNWDNQDQTIIRYEMDGKWDWQEFDSALERGFTMTEGVSHTVHAVLHFTKSSVLPDGAVVVWKRMVSVLPANQGKVMFVCENNTVKTAVNMFSRTNQSLRHRLIVADSLDLGYKVLHEQLPVVNTVLVIEDEDDLREKIVEVLQYEGYKTIEASDGIAGVQRARDHHPSIILCDISLPKMDGYNILLTLREHPATATIPFIFLTGKTERSFMRHGMELGADDYLTKPFTMNELLAAIKSRLERQAVTKKGSDNDKESDA